MTKIERRVEQVHDASASPQPAGPICELAKSAAPGCPVFTNYDDEATVKPTTKRLKRVPFEVSRLMEFCTHRELVNQTGHDVFEWPLVILKELVDNALDAAEEVEVAPVVSIVVDGDTIAIGDNGPGIPAETIAGILDYPPPPAENDETGEEPSP